MIYFGNFSINERFAIHHEIQYRNWNIAGDLEQLLIRGGLQYKFADGKSRFTLGYGFIRSEPYIDEDEKMTINENRIYQEFLTRHKVGRVGFAHRYRFEQRWIENRDDMRLRYRYFLNVTVPINKTNIEQGAVYASAYNEIFIHGDGTLFDRNRVYGALGYAIKDNLRVQAGYMTQVYQGEDNNRGQTNFSLHFNF